MKITVILFSMLSRSRNLKEHEVLRHSYRACSHYQYTIQHMHTMIRQL